MRFPATRSAARSPRRPGGFSLLELAVTVSIIGILAGLLLQRVVFYREQAQRVAMEQVVGTLRSAMHLKAASLIASGKKHAVVALVQQNPMDWLAQKPSNYLGEFDAPGDYAVAPGNWYFDRRNKLLVYVTDGAAGALPKQRKFKTRLIFSEEPMRQEGKAAAGSPGSVESASMDGIVLDQI